MSSFSQNLIIECYEERVTLHLRRTMQERTLFNVADFERIVDMWNSLQHSVWVGHLVLKFLRGVLGIP